MRAEIKRLHSPDIVNLESYTPQVEDNFCFLLQVIAGPLGQDGEESFDVLVCMPRWFEDHFSRDQIIMGRHHLIVFEYNYDRIRSFIKVYFEKCEGENWQEVATKLSRLGKWEFEDYKS
jgi:hypothetical protein